MIPTDYEELSAVALSKGYDSIIGLNAMTTTIQQGIGYKFKRATSKSWCYEFIMPGYGSPPKMDKWEKIIVIK